MLYKEIKNEIIENAEDVTKGRFVKAWNLINEEEQITEQDLKEVVFFEDVLDMFSDSLEQAQVRKVCKIYNLFFDEDIDEDEIEEEHEDDGIILGDPDEL